MHPFDGGSLKPLATPGPFSNRMSSVNTFLQSDFAAPGVTVLYAVDLGVAATCGPKRKSCNVHSGLA